MAGVRLLIVDWLVTWATLAGDFTLTEEERLNLPLKVQVVDSGEAGPTVMIVAGIHGNELAGVEAAKRIASWKMARGRLVIIPEANPQALAARKRLIPGVGDDEADLNRNFSVVGKACHPVGETAAELWRIVQKVSPDWVIDLHESINFRRVNTRNVGNTIIVYPNDKTIKSVEKVVGAINATITEDFKKFTILKPPAKGSLVRAAAETLNAKGFLIETTRREPLQIRIHQHCLLVERFLHELGMIAEETH